MPNKKAFTLIELLVVIGILSVLLAIVLIAINPARQFSQANDTKRRSDINAILNAVHQYAADHKGNITPLNINTTVQNIGLGTGLSDMCALLVPEYMAALPVDPLINNGAPVVAPCPVTPNDYDTGYNIIRSATNNRITVGATGEIPVAPINVTR